MRIFLDANVLFSAAASESATRRLLEAVLRHAEAVTCPHAWEEARRNLALKRPSLLDGLDALERRLEITLAFAAPLPATELPACDEPVLAGAIGAGCSHLWTGDRRHFGRYYGRTLGGVRIVSAAMLADEFAALGLRI